MIQANNTKYEEFNEYPPIVGSVFGKSVDDMYQALMFPCKKEKALRQISNGILSFEGTSSSSVSKFKTDAKNWLVSSFEKIGENLLENVIWIAQIVLLCIFLAKAIISIVTWIISTIAHLIVFGFDKKTKNAFLGIFHCLVKIVRDAIKIFHLQDVWNQFKINHGQRNTNKYDDQDAESHSEL